ncbi:MAG: DUF58 domain-containing protein [Bacteroidetes bacterium]|nr:DUF58 domain-containing protein [Bacteroidota bacterium]
MTTADILKKVRKIELKTKGITNHIFSGEYHSVFKGRGMSFADVRAYQYGDDVRNIDWNVTARAGEAHIKQFEEERELTLMLLIDVSASTKFGNVEESKAELATEIAALLAFSALNNNDKVGVILFSNKVEQYIPPKKGKAHIMRIIRELIAFESSGVSTNLNLAFDYLNHIIKKRCIAFVLSDFENIENGSALRIAARKHDLTALHLFDPIDEKLPKMGIIKIADPETGKIGWINTNSQKLRQQYAEAFMHSKNEALQAFKRSGAGFVSLKTSEQYIKSLRNYFKIREQAR